MISATVSTSGSNLIETYEYDYLGNRTAKTSGGVRTEYTTDLSTGYSQVIKATTGSKSVYYTRGFELISRREGTSSSYYIYDGGLSVRALTNEAGTVTDTLVFDAFGNETAKTGSTDNSYGFQGEEKDETGLYYLRARYMDPSTGTFTSMDTYGGSLSDPMSLHKYMFANSNPAMYCDPSGHDASLVHMVVSMGIGAILAAASYLALWAISSVVDTFRGTNYSAGYSLKGLICSVALGALLGGLGWEFSVAFQAMHLTFMQYVGLSVFLILIGLDLKVWSYFEGKSGDVIWSAILGTLGDVSYVAGGASVGAAVNARNNPLGHHNYGNGEGNPRDSQTVYRSMKDNNRKPETGNTARSLGVRPGPGPNTDIPVDSAGNVKPENGGMSVAPRPEDLKPYRRPPEFGGTGKDPVWSINTKNLGPRLKYVPDADGSPHGTIQPAYEMPFGDYQSALANTQPFWRPVHAKQ